jgi:hypothetical protein
VYVHLGLDVMTSSLLDTFLCTFSAANKQKYEKIGEKKQNTLISELCGGEDRDELARGHGDGGHGRVRSGAGRGERDGVVIGSR